MQGVPDAPNHRQRYDAQLAALARYPGITVVDGGLDHDDIDVAES
jgi:ribose transport system substrate-binding protein